MGIDAIIYLVVGLMAAIGGAVATGVSTKKTNDAQKELAAQQNQWQVEQIAQQNAYNTPENQVSRLLSARINPALAMSNGVVSSGNQTDVARGVLPTLSHADYQPTGADVGNVAHQLAALNQQQPVADSLARLQNAEAVSKEIENIRKPQMVEVELDNLVREGNFVSTQINSLVQMTSDSHNETIQNIHKIAQDMNESVERVNHMKEEERISKEQLDEVKRVNSELIRKMDAEIRKLAADKSYIESQAGLIHNQVAHGNLELRARYGSTKEEIAETLSKEHEQYIKELDELTARSTVRGTLSYQLLDSYTDLFSKITSGVTSTVKAASRFAK